ncbi:MAG: PAS domain S-box protein [Magnetococcales bacterium]|nr:PAS domain S-box protein [Magnetococcales bacterium]
MAAPDSGNLSLFSPFAPETARIVELTRDIVCIVSFEGYFVTVNPAALSLGYSLAELKSRPFIDFVHPDDRERTVEAMGVLVRGGEVMDFENRYRCKNGRIVWLSWRSRPDMAKGVVYAIGRDVTGRKVEDQALADAERRYRTLFELSPDGVLLIDPRTAGFVEFNRAAHEQLGYTREAFARLTVADVDAVETPEITRGKIGMLVGEEGRRLDFETRHRTRQGEIRHVLVTVQSLRLGARLFLYTIFRDITNIRQAEEALVERERRLREIAATMGEGLFVTDRRRRISFVNKAAAELLGWSEAEFLGQDAHHMFHHHANGPELEACPVHRILHQSEGSIRGDEVFWRKDGSPLPVNLIASPIVRQSGIEGVVVAFHDITARVRAEEALHRTLDELRRSNDELDQFSFVASHDLKEPLRKIVTFGDLLREEFTAGLNQEGRFYLERMQRAAHRMQRLIDDLLVYSQLSTRGRPFRPVEPTALMKEAAAAWQDSLAAVGGGIRIAELPPLTGDPYQLLQLFRQLLDNAVKFHRPGVPLEIEVAGRVEGDRVVIEVADNGIGFGEKYQEKIFLPFQRLHGQDDYPGVGMGLTICQRIAQRHGGLLAARGEPGRGARLILTLPVVPLAVPFGAPAPALVQQSPPPTPAPQGDASK